jgi:uncharacterized phage-associated protein
MKILDRLRTSALVSRWRLIGLQSSGMFLSLFNEAKAAEVAAFLLDKAQGSMEVLKLMKLFYLVERESYARHGEPLVGDVAYSFEHGPVLSRVFNLARAKNPETSSKWSEYVAPSKDKNVVLRAGVKFTSDDLLNLSDSDLEVLDAVWGEFGHMSSAELRRYTHTLPEYKEPPPGRRSLIDQVKMLRSVGLSEDQARKQVNELRAHNAARSVFKQPA